MSGRVAGPGTTVLHRASFRAMGTRVTLQVAAPAGRAPEVEAALADAARRFRALEARFSRFRPDSELSLVNRRAQGRPVPVSPPLFELLQLGRIYHERTGGLFDLTLLDALLAAGYDRDFAQLEAPAPGAGDRGPSSLPAAVLPAAGRGCGYRLFEPLPAVALDPGRRLDLGGLAKGWSADRVAAELAAYGDVLVDAGGDLRACGRRRWRIGLSLPRRRPGGWGFAGWRPGGWFPLVDGGVATSSVLRRRWSSVGVVGHHLIDPRTGRPAETDLVQVTVLAATTVEAEVWAKVLLIAGERRARELLAVLEGVEAVWVRTDGSVGHTPGWPGAVKEAAG